ncbi:MAG: DNA-binding response regulator [Chloroflexi bacterium HGW-Chloroflexi-6]|nr:MAG: DNA-binding response regulator [Chloroflexi bacterium HGW-Chloroflexi-6]
MTHENPHILLADDESAITSNLAPFLERSGFQVSVVSDGKKALERALEFPYDLVVLDIMMPLMDGREVLRQLRRKGRLIPVILLTQVGSSTERALALEEGADDYLNKPFDPHELLARIRAVLRRAHPGQPPLASAWMLLCRDLVFDRRARRVTLGSEALILTPKALGVLEYLMTHPDELITRQRLLQAVWGWDYPAGQRTVDTRIAELRRVLKDDADAPIFIETAPGEGYRFAASVRAQP